MSTLWDILLGMSKAGRGLVIILGAYAWIWRPNFVSGEWAGPYWLYRFYDWIAPILLGVIAISFALVFVFRFLMGLFGAEADPVMDAVNGVLRFTIIAAVIAAFPVLFMEMYHMNTVEFDGSRYNLLRQEGFDQASYGVIRCQDPGGFYCRGVLWSPDLPAPLPTPTPVMIEIDGEQIPVANPAPTATPPAQLITDTLGVELSLRIGNMRAPITRTQTLTETLSTADE